MTHALNLNTRPEGSLLRASMDRLTALYMTARKELDRRRRMNEIYAQLAAHSDRDLADLGLLRRDLPRIAAEAAGPR